MRDLAYKAMKAKEALNRKLLREPTAAEIAKELDQPVRVVQEALEAIVDPISIFEPVYSDAGDSVYVLDQLGDPEHQDENWLDHIAIGVAMKSLTQRERRILTLRFYNGKTQTEISQEIGISQAQISRLEKTALQKIRKQMI
jgi:RNA polymerase sporulation-specific sigma factor